MKMKKTQIKMKKWMMKVYKENSLEISGELNKIIDEFDTGYYSPPEDAPEMPVSPEGESRDVPPPEPDDPSFHIDGFEIEDDLPETDVDPNVEMIDSFLIFGASSREKVKEFSRQNF